VSAVPVLTAALLATLAACGGNMRPPDPVPIEYVGTWEGTAGVAIGDEPSREYAATMMVTAVSVSTATVTGLCPDGSGSVEVGGFDGRLAWEQTTTCPGTWLSGCIVFFTFTKGTVERDGVGLAIRASGTAERVAATSACSGTVPLALDFRSMERHQPADGG
jgi:hypothetical protein